MLGVIRVLSLWLDEFFEKQLFSCVEHVKFAITALNRTENRPDANEISTLTKIK